MGLNLVTPGTIADYMRAAVPTAATEFLIGEEVWDGIRRIAEMLPGGLTEFFGFECPLGTERPLADFLICCSGGGAEILAGTNPLRALPDSFTGTMAWRRVREFAIQWLDAALPLSSRVQNVWLEFDIDGNSSALPLPSAFFGSAQIGPDGQRCPDRDVIPESCSWLADVALATLEGGKVAEAKRRRIARCLNALPEGARIFQVGVMLARSSQLTRLCVRGVPLSQLATYLVQAGWPGDIAELDALINAVAPLVERIDLDLDVSSEVQPRIGLECYVTLSEVALQGFLGYLGSAGLCGGRKAMALLRWNGMAHERLSAGIWPEELLSASALLSGRAHSTFLRWLHHVKIVLAPGAAPAAKAYLGVRHFWLQPSLLRELAGGTRPEEYVEGKTAGG